MYGDWSCHCTVKKINEVFPMIDKNLEQDLTFLIFFFGFKISIGYIGIGQAILKQWILSS